MRLCIESLPAPATRTSPQTSNPFFPSPYRLSPPLFFPLSSLSSPSPLLLAASWLPQAWTLEYGSPCTTCVHNRARPCTVHNVPCSFLSVSYIATGALIQEFQEVPKARSGLLTSRLKDNVTHCKHCPCHGFSSLVVLLRQRLAHLSCTSISWHHHILICLTHLLRSASALPPSALLHAVYPPSSYQHFHLLWEIICLTHLLFAA